MLPAEQSPQTLSPSLWPAFGLGLAAAVSNGFARFSYALVLPAMRESFGLSYAEAGWLNTANALGYVIGALSGYWLLRWRRPSELFSAGLCMTVATLVFTGFCSSLVGLSVARLLSGIGAAWAFACGGALIAVRYQDFPKRYGIATGVFFSGAGIGISVSGLFVSPVLAVTGPAGWMYAWWVLGLLAALGSLWPLREAWRVHGGGNSASAARLPLSGLKSALLGYFIFAAGYIVYMTFIFALLRNRGLSWQWGTAIWVVLGAGVSLSPFVWRRALKDMPPELVLSASCATTFVGSVLPLLESSLAACIVSAFIFGLGMFIAPSSVAVLLRKSMPTELLAKGMAFFTVVFSVGQAIGPSLAGWVGDRGTLDTALLAGAALLLASTLVPLVGYLLPAGAGGTNS
ncbi:YbfB/YjiJ family MFS transporter [Verminephrobacter aporrectodeae]|uniref:YbfB/YjiJ family MFS transporter n=1 Tax=Verminephrobacter aporrectodeae TaxID=1110389 RepID=UPI000237656F|nr:YbfB/YjiJ family MFS transporter [Verminephrobacter aporrectodeae]MCW8166769.1 YbfB/YjiJ family MFS transporter [Verminephrobacter aporrectodeae subsp. tuberculatae]MCW8170374.1 YbfB/YjiJ family MFS transporter [Verminephrobacter aporrectodeae subsp. tuberculatae]MCW8174708.1 YbfB/YjiJ family MFS transporter [Verminephrobacter aporrectodeae subsp. tuberculatae]MCW8201298.1 YbfB/YjiJ family MFS transporter [Verminephrobacter aporrectodeae subsp. tuberculatae]